MKKNKSQEYAILWLHSQNKKSGDIADELNIGIEKVEAVVRVNSEPKASTNEGSAIKKTSKSKSLMITQTSSKKNKSVAIMTPEASMLNDELKKKFAGKTGDTQNFIFRPND
jgi:hypothetical protein